MNWFTKLSREHGQTDMFGLTEIFEDPYAKSKDPKKTKKKDLAGEALQTTFGPPTHNPNEQAAGGQNENQINSLTSDYTKDEITNEGITGEERPRTDDIGGPGAQDSPMGAGAGAAPGTEDDGYGSYILRHTPSDAKPSEVATDNFLRFQNRPAKKRVSLRGHNVNVID